MKSAFPWLVALALLAAAAFFYSSNRKLAAEAIVLRTETAQVEVLRTELEQLKTNGSPAQAEEIERLRKNNTELLRLRNELQQLRGDKKELAQKAQAAEAQAQAARAVAEAARSQVASISTNIQAITAQALADQQRALAARYGNPSLTPQQALNTCINNLRQLDGAAQQWALENKKDAKAIPQAKELAAYIKGEFPKCPAGGTYTIGAVESVPTCSVPGHALPQ